MRQRPVREEMAEPPSEEELEERSFCEAVSQVSFQIELGGILVFSINTSIFDILSL